MLVCCCGCISGVPGVVAAGSTSIAGPSPSFVSFHPRLCMHTCLHSLVLFPRSMHLHSSLRSDQHWLADVSEVHASHFSYFYQRPFSSRKCNRVSQRIRTRLTCPITPRAEQRCRHRVGLRPPLWKHYHISLLRSIPSTSALTRLVPTSSLRLPSLWYQGG